MATKVCYPNNGSEDGGWLASSAVSWAAALAITNPGNTGGGSGAKVGAYKGGGIWYIYTAVVRFDTDLAGGELTGAVLSYYGETDNTTTDFTIEARKHPGLTMYGSTIGGASYVAQANWGDMPLCATFATSGLSVSAYNDFTNEAGFLAQINTAGITELMLVSSRVRAGTEPTDTVWERADLFGSFGTVYDPMLTLTYTPASPRFIASGRNRIW